MQTNPLSSSSIGTSRQEELRQFGKAIDVVRERVERQIGEEDVAYVRRLRRFSTVMQIAGRTLIHVSPEPVTFLAGVGALWIHKQLEATEIGHTALHGAFDGLPGAEAFQSKTFRWATPIDEESWRYGHNVKHHQYTNVAGKDPDIHFGPIRLNAHTPHRRFHYIQVPFVLAESASFLAGMNLHFTGIGDVLSGARSDRLDFLPDRSPASVRGAFKKAARKYLPYYAKEYGLYPALAGPMFGKVMLGNWMAATIRDLYTAATIYCGHVGPDVVDYPEGTRAHGRGEWYKMQIEGANNFEVSRPVSMLCGALDKQIEHHLFPKFPTNRLREIAPEIRRICVEHGVAYRTDTWGNTLRGVMKKLWTLSFPSAKPNPPRAPTT